MNIQFLTEWLVSVDPEFSSSFLALWHEYSSSFLALWDEYIIAPDSVPKRIIGLVSLIAGVPGTVLSVYATGNFMLDVRKSWRLFDELCKERSNRSLAKLVELAKCLLIGVRVGFIEMVK